MERRILKNTIKELVTKRKRKRTALHGEFNKKAEKIGTGESWK